jgi:hypothetical protein
LDAIQLQILDKNNPSSLLSRCLVENNRIVDLHIQQLLEEAQREFDQRSSHRCKIAQKEREDERRRLDEAHQREIAQANQQAKEERQRSEKLHQEAMDQQSRVQGQKARADDAERRAREAEGGCIIG